MKKVTLAVSGDRGSFSEEAGLLYASRVGMESELIFATDMERVLSKVEGGEAGLGIFPVVNSLGGLVRPAFDAMGRHLFTVIDELVMEVNQCLMALPGVGKEAVTEIASHSQALKQCERYLESAFPGIPLVEWEDTAKAAKDLTEGKLPGTAAVIAPARSAALYGLALLESGIQDRRPNLTTFIVVKNHEA
ncbi:MAG: prephenate dehydratase domain-containing protein [Patescibacteria group bacterium]